MIQTAKNISDKEVSAINGLLNKNEVFKDRRDQRTTGTYIAFVSCVYAFLSIITLVTVLNIINSISMSVSARIKQYGAMRAVGMDEHQIMKMIAAEAFTYAISGCIIGCVAGLLISKFLYGIMITSHFSYAVWTVPVVPLLVILIFVFAAAVAAVWAPAKRIRNISVTETINEL